METVGYAALQIIPTTKGLSQSLSSQVNAPLAKTGTTAGKAAGIGYKTSFLSSMKGISGPLAALVGAAAIGKFFTDGVSGASDLAESGNKINVVFGDAADSILGFADNAALALGQTELEARNAAATFGVFGKSAGLGGDDLSKFSTKLVTLSGDLASFYNTSPADAITAVGSALRGEAEPIRAYGVLLDDATLRQQALKDGLIQTTEQALTPQQKVLASYAVIMKQTGDAQGDFKRTQDGLANQQRILSAQWTEMKVNLGSKLLPVVTDFTTFLNEDMLPGLSVAGGLVKDVAAAFGSLPGPVKETAVVLGAAALAVKLLNASGATAGISKGLAEVGFQAQLAAEKIKFADLSMRGLSASALTAGRSFAQSKVGIGALGLGLSVLNSNIDESHTATKGLMDVASMAAIGFSVGGPWGAAIGGGVGLLQAFTGGTDEAKEASEALTKALEEESKSLATLLNQKTGGTTEDAVGLIRDTLQEMGSFDVADTLGINLSLLTKAASGAPDALKKVNDQLDAYIALADPAAVSTNATNLALGQLGGSSGATAAVAAGLLEDADAAQQLKDDLIGQNTALADARKIIDQTVRSMGGLGGATDKTESHVKSLAEILADEADAADESRKAHNRLAAELAENITGNIAYKQAVADAMKEARHGAATLNTNTQEGRDNKLALLGVSDAWNDLTDKQKKARGAYKGAKQDFLDVADALNLGANKAERLAEKLLDLPNEGIKIPVELAVRTTGDARGLGGSVDAFAAGGKVGGRGTGDRRLIAADPREWVMGVAPSKYYGDAFMSALNKMQIPKFAAGGPVSGAPQRASVDGGVTINIDKLMPHDYGDFLQQTQRRARARASSER